MSIEFQESRAKFEKFIRDGFVSESIEQYQSNDFSEMVEEIEEELLDAITQLSW